MTDHTGVAHTDASDLGWHPGQWLETVEVLERLYYRTTTDRDAVTGAILSVTYVALPPQTATVVVWND